MIEKQKPLGVLQYWEQLQQRYKDHDLSGLSAEITYYLILSFFPFLLFLINLVSFTALTNEMLITGLTEFMPIETGDVVRGVLLETMQAKSTVLLIVGMLGSLWASSRGMAAMIKGLNKAYAVKEGRDFFKTLLIALIFTISLAMMIIFSFVMIIFGKLIGDYMFGLFGATELFNNLWSFLRYFIPLIFMLITFSLLYSYAPNTRLIFKRVRIGTIFATLGWIGTSLLFSLYVNNFSNFSRVYGSLGGFIALMIWLYISTLIVLIGGELNAIHNDFSRLV